MSAAWQRWQSFSPEEREVALRAHGLVPPSERHRGPWTFSLGRLIVAFDWRARAVRDTP